MGRSLKRAPLCSLTWEDASTTSHGESSNYSAFETVVLWTWTLLRPLTSGTEDVCTIQRGNDSSLVELCRLRVFENRVLRRIFGPKRDEVTGEWRKLHNEELHNLYSSPDIFRQVKSRWMRWAGHVARIGEEKKVYKVLVGKPEGRPRRRWDQIGSSGDWLGGCGLDSSGSGLGPLAGCCECCVEPSDSCATELVLV
jgi:hypothetical protein